MVCGLGWRCGQPGGCLGQTVGGAGSGWLVSFYVVLPCGLFSKGMWLHLAIYSRKSRRYLPGKRRGISWRGRNWIWNQPSARVPAPGQSSSNCFSSWGSCDSGHPPTPTGMGESLQLEQCLSIKELTSGRTKL